MLVIGDKYIENIKLVYPDLSIEEWHANDIGQNNNVFIVNNSLVFRFPKYEQGITQLKKEKEILEYIQNVVTIPVPYPIYEYFDTLKPREVFTGYNLIAGVPLWRESLENINKDEPIKRLASQLVTFLIELHSTSKDALKLEDSDPREEMSELFDKIRNKLFPYIRKEAQDEITQSFSTFLNRKAFLNVKTTLIHGDFGASNILWNPKSTRVSGIIDFGEAGLGDPAYDFAGILSSYGEDFFNVCIDLYPDGDEISERVKFYKSTFALQEALHGIENDDPQAFENGIKDYR
ncbi:phosphotransferase family protein [Salimicrobium album]|uniref:Aminoglycoside 2''-phosphotransferase n=1 Tax=Salimicrobium album TaxID=50717 RepID=A0A1H3INF3_9BACI|nr:aminoglycoside phosphotransferase family protein [Salimicrobium album]SDY29212.1 aminoglycoside 2''-phosphotransferase [Salimicrobium album]